MPVTCTNYKLKCGGCPLLNQPYPDQLKHKQQLEQRLLGRFAPVSPVLGQAEPWHYRNKAIATFATGPRGRLTCGIYAAGTHRVLPYTDCLLQDTVINQTIAAVLEAARACRWPAFEEDRGTGLLRHVLVRRGKTSGQVLVVLVIVLVVKVLLDLFMNTKAGFLLRAEGDNPAVVATLARDGGLVKIEGLVIANALVALSGAVMAQKNRVFETGAIVFGLAAVIIGTNIFKNRQKVNSSTAAIVGSIIYKACVALALSMGLVPQDLKLVTAALFLIILVLGNVRRKKVKFHA